MDWQRVASLGSSVLNGQELSRQEAMELSGASGEALWELIHQAGRIRRRHFGDQVALCAIASLSLGGCSEDCKWCGQSSRYATSVSPRRASADEMVTAARGAYEAGVSCFCMVSSGRRPSPADVQLLTEVNEALKAQGLPPACASLGELDAASAASLSQRSVGRYNHNLETSPAHFAELVGTHTWADRQATLQQARQAGLELCSGGIFGTGESWADRVELAMALRETKPDVAPLNFLMPRPGTPLGAVAPLSPMEGLHIIALYRLILPQTDLKMAGGRTTTLRQLQPLMFQAGITSLMIGDYLTAGGVKIQDDLQMIADLGLTVVRRQCHQKEVRS